MSEDHRSFKRTCDLLFAGLGLLVLFPILLVISALLMGFGFHNPLFLQKRVGLGGRIFVIFKFRTLRDKTCRQRPQAVQRYADSFTTFLRITGLDELPQIFNVLRGEMALVGPRPHSLADHSQFSNGIPDYSNRLAVKPGMTGLAQIKGWRGPVCSADHLRARIACDLEYIARQSILLDCRILIRTLAVPLGKGTQSCQRHKPCLHCAQRVA
jgi:lipopolysaccharide/colanic/teichoic acid biosynthesis glycosyltransferase